MSSLTPDIVARVRLYPTERGGRLSFIPPSSFGCPMFFGEEGFDCRLLLGQSGFSLLPGMEADVPIKFLNLDLVKSCLIPGNHFKLWEGRFFAEGEILEVMLPAEVAPK